MTRNINETEPMWNMFGDNSPLFKCVERQEDDVKFESVSKIRLKLQDVQDAHNRIKNNVVFTPIVEAKHVGKKFCNVYLKCENLQNTGSFKARGACNVLSSMSPADKSKGCTISGGRNFLYAMTYYGFKQSVPINVVVPKDCPLSEKQRYKEDYAIVKTYGNDLNDASLHALSYCDEIGSNYVHGTDRLDLIAGYGTLGLELLTQLDNMDAIICPVGTGGLVASLVLAVKTLKPNCLIYGVECSAAPTMTKALQEKKPVMIQLNPTIADSLAKFIASNNAFNIIRGYLDRMEAKHVGKKFCNVYLKCENLQNTGSFKARGACNVLSSMSPADKSKGCTISGGRNFLYAMTYYGFKQSVPINVVVPKDCPLSEKQRYKEDYAIVKTYGNDLNDASLHALSYCDEIGSNYVHGTDRLDLIAGYGTLGLELLTQLDNMDAIICPVGTGGLVASLVLAVKTLKPNCLIYGVECSAAPTMTKALQEKKPVMIQLNPTIADSLAKFIASNNAFNIIRGYLDRMITVDEMWISRAMICILEREKMVVEGAAACSVAAIMAGKVPELRGKNVVCILSGGNINSTRMSRVIDRGMAAEGRLVKFSATLPDVPGAMAKLLARVTDTGADVKSFVPERTWMRRDIFTISINMLIETSDMNHAKELEKKLIKDYPHSHFIIV